MRRIKVILAALAAMMMMAALSAPAMAQGYDYTYGTGSDYCYGGCGNSDPNYNPNDPNYGDDCDWDGC